MSQKELENRKKLSDIRKQQEAQQRNYREFIESMTQEVKERELRARFARANWELMYYSMEAEDLQPKYKEYVLREQDRQEKAKEEERQSLLKQQEDLLAGIKQADATLQTVLVGPEETELSPEDKATIDAALNKDQN